MAEENSLVFNQLLISGKWIYKPSNTILFLKREIITSAANDNQHERFHVKFHKFLWWKWQTLSKSLAVILNKEESKCLKKWAVEEAKYSIIRFSVKD